MAENLKNRVENVKTQILAACHIVNVARKTLIFEESEIFPTNFFYFKTFSLTFTIWHPVIKKVIMKIKEDLRK